MAITECPSVIALHGSGPIPFAAFKRVQRMTQWEPWQPAVFSSIAQHCRQLRNLDFHMGHAVWGTRFPASMPADAPAERRMAAIRSLAGLQQLQLLDFAVNDSAEVAALAAITQLQQLRLRVPASSSCSIAGIMHVVALRQLKFLTLELYGLPFVASTEAESLLVALQGVPCVEILCIAGTTLRAGFRAAVAALRAASLLAPADVKIREHKYRDSV